MMTLNECNKKELIYILQKAISTFGKRSQVDMAIEEMSELTKALLKERRGDRTQDNVIEEIADVYIMLAQLTMMFDKNNEVQAQIEYKIKRLAKLLDISEV